MTLARALFIIQKKLEQTGYELVIECSFDFCTLQTGDYQSSASYIEDSIIKIAEKMEEL